MTLPVNSDSGTTPAKTNYVGYHRWDLGGLNPSYFTIWGVAPM